LIQLSVVTVQKRLGNNQLNSTDLHTTSRFASGQHNHCRKLPYFIIFHFPLSSTFSRRRSFVRF
jgi:hypothetical protein